MSRLLSAVLLTLLAASLSAQPSPASRPGANFIRVDMYATRDGQVVGDLQPEDVEVLEDGALQKVETFAWLGMDSAGSAPRELVVFLDTLHGDLEGSSSARVPVVRFLDRVVSAGDRVALMTPEMLARDIVFVSKAAALSNVMQDDWSWGRRGTSRTADPKEQLYDSCYPSAPNSATAGIAAEMTARRRERLTFDALEDLVAHFGPRDGRKAVLTMSDGWRLGNEDRRLAATARTRGRGRGPGDEPAAAERPRVSVSEQRECAADRFNLAMQRGGVRLRSLTEAANRATVSFYAIDPRGLTSGDRGPLVAARHDSLRELASETDGIAIVSRGEVDAAMDRIAADLSSYYLLGYNSTNTKLDGRFRSIAVRVKRPGIQVRARRGYRGLTAEELVGVAAGERRAAAATAVVVNPRARLRMWTAAWTPEDSPSAAWIVGELDYVTRRELVWSAGASAEVVVVAADGREVLSSVAALPAGEGTFSLRVPDSAALTPGDYAVRVRVRPESDPALPVTDTARLIVPASATAIGDAVMWRRGPSTGLKYLVTADPRFQRSERVRFEMPTNASGTAAGRMLDRAGNPMRVPVQISERQDPAEPFRWIIADVALSPLAAGDYSIEVSLAGARRVATFKVVP